MPRRVVACNAKIWNTEHGYEARKGNPIPKEGRIRIRNLVGFVITMQMDEERGAYCNTVEILESGRRDVQRDVSGRPPRGGAGFQEAIDFNYEPPIPLIVVPFFEGKNTLSSSRPFSSETVNVVLEECDLELWTVETGEGEKHSRINLLNGPEQIKPNFPQI